MKTDDDEDDDDGCLHNLKSWIQFQLQPVSLTARPYHSQNERNERWRIHEKEKDPPVKEMKKRQRSSTLKLQPQIALHYYCNHATAVTNPSHSQNPTKFNMKKLSWKLQPTS